jgi:hypothetical protein
VGAVTSSFLARLALAAFALAVAIACGAPAAGPAAATPKRAVDAPVSAADWKELCEAHAERARRCPGPAPEPLATCTQSAACFGALVRADVIRALGKCQSENDCTRPCTIDRVTATLPPTPTNTALDEACATRRVVCPTLDCNALVRPVRSLDVEYTTPLIECMKFERSCLDVAACVLEKMTPVIAKVSACGPGPLTGTTRTPDRPPAP